MEIDPINCLVHIKGFSVSILTLRTESAATLLEHLDRETDAPAWVGASSLTGSHVAYESIDEISLVEG